MKRPTLALLSAALLTLSPILGATSAQASTAAATMKTVTSEACIQQLEELASQDQSDLANTFDICTGSVTITESDPVRATAKDIADARAAGILAGPEAYYRNWTHTYLGGGFAEIHRGRTFWDGDVAWVSPYGGIGGSHECHTEGSWSVGWAVKQLSCDKPGAGSSADAFYRFDASILVEGSPITLGIGLHYSTNASGGTTTWQVGG